MKKPLVIVVVLVIVAQYAWDNRVIDQLPDATTTGTDSVLASAFDRHQSDLQIEGAGRVFKLLSDDNYGSRHQRFILKLDSGQTLLVAHNIDLASRLPELDVGDSVEFFGEYEWSAKGGVIHWTHNDPNGRHVSGWLKHNGKMYQ